MRGLTSFLILALLLGSGLFLPDTLSHAQTARADNQLAEQANSVRQTIEIVDRLSDSPDLSDEALVGASVKYQNAINTARELIRQLDSQATELNTRLEEIGPPPEDSSVSEPEGIAATRSRLNNEKSALAVAKTELEEAINLAQQSIDEIAVRRQEAFAAALSKRTQLDRELVTKANEGLKAQSRAMWNLVRSWVLFIIEEKPWQALGSAMISLALAVFLSFNFNRFFGTYLERTEEEPDYFKRVFTAYWATLLPSLATAIFLGASYALFRQFNLLTPKISELLPTLFVMIAGVVFAWNFCRAVFAPNSWNWRLISISNRAAKRMFWLTFLLFTVYALDYFFDRLDAILSTSLSITVVQGAVASVIIGGLLIAMALINPASGARKQTPVSSLRREASWARWITIPLILSGAVLILSALSGYIGFSRFLAQQIVVTGTIIAVMFIGILAARELAREGVMANTALGSYMTRRGYEPFQIEQASLVGSGLFIFFILTAGIPAVFMQWGTRIEEITAAVSRAFTGFDVMGFRISLSGILVGLLVFAVIIVLTRLFQGWLSRSVFPRSRIDPGVSNSIRAGVGYVGFAVAALVAVTSAGLDLSSLAIVAGALSLGIGFGLQNIVSNFVSGLILLVERPIKVGDWIIVGAAEGTVKRISVRATEIETFRKQSIIVPNSELINSQVTNWTLKSKAGRVDIDVGIAYGADARLAEKILYEIAHNHAMVGSNPEPNVWFVNFGASSLDFRLRMFLPDIGNVVTVETEVRFEILRRFKEAGIEIPFPQQDVNFRFGDEHAARIVAGRGDSQDAPRKQPAKTAKAAKPSRSRRKSAGETADGDE